MWRLKFIKKSLEIGIIITSFVGVFVAFFPFDKNWWIGVVIVAIVFVLSFTIVFLCYISSSKRVLASYGNHSIVAMYGDILSISKKDNVKPVVIIPVNSAFDYIVEDDLTTKNPIVSANSLHGKFIKKLTNLNPEKMNQLGQEIQRNIQSLGLVKHCLTNKRGNQDTYSLGTHIFIERDDCTYMLFALTAFDENNEVIYESLSTFSRLVNQLCLDVNSCQGRPVYIPVMGVGLSGFCLDHKNAYSLIKEAFLSKRLTLISDVTIIIYDDDRQKVSIYD